MIVKQGNKYAVKSEHGKNLGKGLSLAGAKKRLAQVEYFKHREAAHKMGYGKKK